MKKLFASASPFRIVEKARGSLNKPLENHYFLGVWFQMLRKSAQPLVLPNPLKNSHGVKCENMTEKEKNKPKNKVVFYLLCG
jgi:hypothetical protein